MRCAVALLLALVAVAGCGGGTDEDAGAPESRGAAGTAAAGGSEPTARASRTTGGRSSFVVVTSLLGKPLPKEPGCEFAKTFIPDNPSLSAYDGALSLTVTCRPSDGYTPQGQIVNRRGSVPRKVTCRNTTHGQLFCIYVPRSTVGLYFTGTDRAVVRRRLEHLIEVVDPLPTGVTPLPSAAAR